MIVLSFVHRILDLLEYEFEFDRGRVLFGNLSPNRDSDRCSYTDGNPQYCSTRDAEGVPGWCCFL
jgi:hypothetical protein